MKASVCVILSLVLQKASWGGLLHLLSKGIRRYLESQTNIVISLEIAVETVLPLDLPSLVIYLYLFHWGTERGSLNKSGDRECDHSI